MRSGGGGEGWAHACDMALRTWTVPAVDSIDDTFWLGTHTLGEYTLAINFNYEWITASTSFSVTE